MKMNSDSISLTEKKELSPKNKEIGEWLIKEEDDFFGIFKETRQLF
jgi:hypothetical protein